MIYVNDHPQVSEISSTLFADDTYLALSDKSLVSLETKVNTLLQNIDIWLRRNKFSLNYSKTTYLPEVESRTQGSRPRPRPRTEKKSEAKAKAKDSLSEDRHSRGQGQECSRPRPRTKDTKRKCSPKKKKKKRSSQKFFRRSPKKKKKVFTKIFQAISTKKRFPKNFSSAPQNFNIPKNSAVLEPRTGQFSRT